MCLIIYASKSKCFCMEKAINILKYTSPKFERPIPSIYCFHVLKIMEIMMMVGAWKIVHPSIYWWYFHIIKKTVKIWTIPVWYKWMASIFQNLVTSQTAQIKQNILTSIRERFHQIPTFHNDCSLLMKQNKVLINFDIKIKQKNRINLG